jgi:hypothetical protein
MLELKLPDQMVAIIMRTLGRQPHDDVRQTIDEIARQVNAQRQMPQEGNVTRLRDDNQ